MSKPKYKKGETVEIERGGKIVKAVVKRVIDNHLIPIFQYSFEAPYDGFACGEQSVRKDGADRFPKLGECLQDNSVELKTRINTIASSTKHIVDFSDTDFGDFSTMLFNTIFFKPSIKMVDWIKEYANGRVIIDVGAGQGHLTRMLKMRGAKAIGLEPNLDKEKWIEWRTNRFGFNDFDINEMLPMTVEKAKNLIKGFGSKALLVFARPCHGNFVYNGLSNLVEGQEALYITLPENIDEYDDLGHYKERAVKLDHKGLSEDNEVVYSIVK